MEVDGNCIGKVNKSKKITVMNQDSSLEIHNNNNDNNGTSTGLLTTDDYYTMNNHKENPRLLIIFNHENFEETTKRTQRKGTDEDVAKIKDVFRGKLGFEIHSFKDLSLLEIRDVIQQHIKIDYYHKDRDCLGIFVLTHGEENDILWAKDTKYNAKDELWGMFTADKCPSYAGKPKLFFFQACKGQDVDPGMSIPPSIQTQYDVRKDKIPVFADLILCYATYEGKPKLFFFQACKGQDVDPGMSIPPSIQTQYDVRKDKIPVFADLILCYATYEGHFAYRNPKNGSWWVTVLCDTLAKNYEDKDLHMILTLVNGKMTDFTSKCKDLGKHDKKQMCHFTSSLTKLLLFGKRKNHCQ